MKMVVLSLYFMVISRYALHDYAKDSLSFIITLDSLSYEVLIMKLENITDKNIQHAM